MQSGCTAPTAFADDCQDAQETYPCPHFIRLFSLSTWKFSPGVTTGSKEAESRRDNTWTYKDSCLASDVEIKAIC